MYNRNRIEFLDAKYVAQQRAIKTVCNELGLVAYLPDYHAAKDDPNTVLVYSKFAADHNFKMDCCEASLGYRPEKDMPYICSLSNTDIIGRFDLNFMNHGSIDLRGFDYEEKIRAFIKQSWEAYMRKYINPRAAELHKVYSGGVEC